MKKKPKGNKVYKDVPIVMYARILEILQSPWWPFVAKSSIVISEFRKLDMSISIHFSQINNHAVYEYSGLLRPF